MSASQKTSHYNLPIYAGADVTGWLTGFNPAMQAIDEALFNINQTAEDANGTAAGAEASAQQAISSAQATANLLAQTNNTVTSLVNKLTFNQIQISRPHSGALITGESNSDYSITILRVGFSEPVESGGDYTLNGTQIYELGSYDGKLVNNVVSGSSSAGFTGTAKTIANIPVSISGNERLGTIQCFYDNVAKKTRFGIGTNGTLKAIGSSCANIVFTNTQIV